MTRQPTTTLIVFMAELVNLDACPRYLGTIDTGGECNTCDLDCNDGNAVLAFARESLDRVASGSSQPPKSLR